MKRLLITICLVLLAVTAVAGGGAWWVTSQWDRPFQPGDTVVVEIPAGATLRAASQQLQRAGVVQHARLLEWLGRWQGTAARIRPGEYRFSPAMTPRQILTKLIRGEVEQHPVTLPEGLTVGEIIDRLVAAGFGSRADYLAALADPALIRAHRVVTAGVKIPFEGYLFPDTYYFTKGTPARAVVATLLDRLDAAFTPRRMARMRELGWNRHQVLTLASLIEKETGLPEERPRISAVFHNRLKKRMRLQTDPTVIYASPDYDGDIRYRDLRRDDPYNTYRNRGLPPGPIASAGEAAIEAALFPADDDALYFVSKGDGSHHFSTTAKGHQNAVRKYLKGHR